MNVLSLFDGMSCGMIALVRSCISIDRYVAFEIDKHAIAISEGNYPQIEREGDVFEGDFTKYKGFDLLIGGSPCTHWSIANKNRETTSEGVGYELFSQYVRALKEANPRYFLYENNASISQEIQSVISGDLGVQPIMIDSKLVSAQQRKRLYWTNIPNVGQPEDRKLYLSDVFGVKVEENFDKIVMTKREVPVTVRRYDIDTMELAEFLKHHKKTSGKTIKQISEYCGVPKTKAEHWFRADSSFAIPDSENWPNLKEFIGIDTEKYDAAITTFITRPGVFDTAKRVYDVSGKHPTLTTGSGLKSNIKYKDELLTLLPEHAEILQTVPVGFTAHASDRQRLKALGNGWTVDVIAHIFKGLKR